MARLMDSVIVVGIVASWLVSASAGQPPPEDATYAADKTGQKIVEFVQSSESVGFSGVVLAARDGRVIAAVGVGSADLKDATTITPATLFEIASVTKSFTATAVMRLVQEGRLSIDSPIRTYLPGVPENCQAITVRHLLQHTSGIPGTNSDGGGDDLSVVLPMFLKGGPQHDPGTHWEYWNQGYSLLSEIIASVSGESYTRYCRLAIFEPAGMKNSGFTGDEAPQGAVVAVGRSMMGPPRSALEPPYGSYGFQYRGMGGLVTNVWDLWRWDRALRGRNLLNERSKQAMFTPGLGDYGLGWFIRTGGNGRLVESHSGNVRGFVCDVRRYPKEDAALFVLCNRDNLPVKQIADGIEAMLFDEPSRLAPPPHSLDAALAKELTGRFEDDRRNVLTVSADGKVTRAVLEWGSGPTTRAILGQNNHGDIVFYEWSSVSDVAVRNERGRVVGLAIMDQRFRRAPAGTASQSTAEPVQRTPGGHISE